MRAWAPAPDVVRIGLRAQGQGEGVDQDAFAGASLAGHYGEAILQVEVDGLGDGQVADVKLAQHASVGRRQGVADLIVEVDGFETTFVEPGEPAAELREERLAAVAHQAGNVRAAGDTNVVVAVHGECALSVDAGGDAAVATNAQVDGAVRGQHERCGRGEMGRDGRQDEELCRGIQNRTARREGIAGRSGGAGHDDAVAAQHSQSGRR